MLQQMDETAERFFQRTFYTYSHDRAIEAVADGVADGAAVDSLVLDYALQRDPDLASRIRIIHTSEAFGIPPVVVPATLPVRQKAQMLRELLLTMHEDAVRQGRAARIGHRPLCRIENAAYDGVRASCTLRGSANEHAPTVAGRAGSASRPFPSRRLNRWAEMAWRAAGSVDVRTKILGMVLALTTVLGLAVTLQVRAVMTRIFAEELESRGVSVASDLASRSVDPILLNDTYALHELLRETVINHPDALYAFVTDDHGQCWRTPFGEAGFPSRAARHQAAGRSGSQRPRRHPPLGLRQQ
jgi:hypothetical protein